MENKQTAQAACCWKGKDQSRYQRVSNDCNSHLWNAPQSRSYKPTYFTRFKTLLIWGPLASCPWRCRLLRGDAVQKLVPQSQISDPYGFPSHSKKGDTWIPSQQTWSLSAAEENITNGTDFLEDNDCRGKWHLCSQHHWPEMAKGYCLTGTSGTFLHPHSPCHINKE